MKPLLFLLLIANLTPVHADVCSRNRAETDYVATRRAGEGVTIRFCTAEGACADQGYVSLKTLERNRQRLFRSAVDVLIERGLPALGLASGVTGVAITVGAAALGAGATAAGSVATLASRLNPAAPRMSVPQLGTLAGFSGGVPLLLAFPAIFGAPMVSALILVLHDDFDSRSEEEKMLDAAETHGAGDYLAEATALRRSFLLSGSRESGYCQRVNSMPEYQRHLARALRALVY